MKIKITLIGLTWMLCNMLFAQQYSDVLKGYLLKLDYTNGDTIPSVWLPEVPVYPPIKSKKKEKFYWKTVRDVKKVYPYVKIVGSEYTRIQAMSDTIKNKRVRKKYMKKYEKELLSKYKPVLKKFTLSQGKLMIRLIDRECGQSSYSLIQAFRGNFVAWWWQLFAGVVGADLKENYDISTNEKDQIIERVITLYEAGML